MAAGKDDPNAGRNGPLSWFKDLDRILRGELTDVSRLRTGGIEISALRISACLVVLGMVYGACMGTFAIFRVKSPNGLQVLSSMVKVPLLFYLTLLVTLPSLYVFNALVGSRLTLTSVIRLLVASLGVMVTVLASLGPIVAFFSVFTTSYPFMQVFNVVIFAISGVLGLTFLLQTLHRLNVAESIRNRVPESPTWEPQESAGTEGDSDLQQRSGPLNPLQNRAVTGHVKTVFRLWVIVFGLVGAQMGWVLRPFIGDPNLPFAWFRVRESNFFLAVLHALGRLFS